MARSKATKSSKSPKKSVTKSKKKTTKRTKSVKTAKSSKSSKDSKDSKSISKKRLSKKDLTYFKEKLLEEKQKVLEEMGNLQSNNLMQSISDQSGEISRYSYHLGDTASLSYGREFSMGLAERQQKYLEQVDEALERIENNTYGICKVTGEIIPKERLEAVPVAKYSVKGKEILEKKRRL
jgi:RNA polymerase-binding protein DksA